MGEGPISGEAAVSVERFNNETRSRLAGSVNFSFRHFNIEKGTGTKMCPAIVPGVVTGDVPISYWPIFFFLFLVRVPEVFAKCSSAQCVFLVSKLAKFNEIIAFCHPRSRLVIGSFPGASSSKVPVTFRARKAVLRLPCFHSRSKFQ